MKKQQVYMPKNVLGPELLKTEMHDAGDGLFRWFGLLVDASYY